jgi:hypothetical protein
MILLTNTTFGANDKVAMMKTFATEEELWRHIQHRIRLNQPSDKKKWRFSYYSPYTLADLMADRQERSFAEMATQACEQQHSLIVIHQGEQKPLVLVAVPELDTVRLKRDWCKAYAKANQLLIVRE